MPRNLELKARVVSAGEAARHAAKLHARKKAFLRHVDTYFDVPAGRLKLRETDGSSAELIRYERPDRRGARYSDYSVVPVRGAKEIKEVLTRLYGVRVVVKKTRTLYLYENARIHLDRVQRLGTFVEFEVLVTRGKQQARRLMNELVRAFRIPSSAIRPDSYSDILSRQKKRTR
ncbi:MAG: class IV adenylate cyclase [Ignavibacteriales bacterium]|nr:class IV adenylate cyclase [Ignavibacteriales bacterium]